VWRERQHDPVPGAGTHQITAAYSSKRRQIQHEILQGSDMKHLARCPDCAGTVQNLPRNAGRGMIWIYRHTLSPLVGYNCRHLPTCSVYGDEAIARYGLWAGGWMTLARLLRCQPWGTSGIDNVPDTVSPDARWYLPWRYARWRGVNDDSDS
jgi:hypothetical protein